MKNTLIPFLSTIFFITCHSDLSVSQKNTNRTYTVKMLDRGEINKDSYMVFEPTYLEVKKDSDIKFILIDKGHGSRSISTPKTADQWNSGLNNEITINLKNDGYYLYDCRPHSTMGMVGLIKVGAPNIKNTKVTLKHLKKLLETSFMNKNRISGLIDRLEVEKEKEQK